MDIEKYRKMFLSEASEHLQQMAEQLVTVEADPDDRGGIDALFREAHSIKGMAATMNYDATARLAHHLEDRLAEIREQGQISSEMIDYLLEGTDLLEKLLEDIRTGLPERDVESFLAAERQPPQEHQPPADNTAAVAPPVVADQVPAGEAENQTSPLLVSLKFVDSVAAPGPRMLVLLKRLGQFGQILESTPSEAKILQGETSRTLRVRLQTEVAADEIKAQLQVYSELSEISFPAAPAEEKRNRRPASSGSSVRVDTGLLDRFINLTGELITNRYMLQGAASDKNWSEVDEGLGQLARLVKSLHHQVLQVRMMPLESVTGRLPRAVRDLCRSNGKQARLEVEGAAIELDRSILEALTDPLTHMIRNAIDHGIEQSGTVRVRAWRERDQVLIQVADDGKGIDPEKIRARAVERKLVSPAQAQAMRDYDVLQLICQPGFSTAAEVTETSGRGVGMDVVKTAVERLGGVLLIESAIGDGTRITLKLPLSVAIIRVLLIDCGGCLMGLPITRVLQTVEIEPKQVQTSGKQLVMSLQGELLPLLSLRKILNQPKGPALDPLPLVVTEVFGRKVGLVVDALVGQQEVFVQSLPSPFDQLRGNSGGAILGDGRILFLLDLQSKLETRRGKRSMSDAG